MKYLILFIILSNTIIAKGQTEEEIEKMMKKAQSIIDKSEGKNKNGSSTGFDDVDAEELLLKLPPKKAALLAAIPKKTLSKAELATYITSLKTQLLQKAKPAKVQVTKAAINSIGNQADKLHMESLSAWYNGLQQEAALLLFEAAQKKPDDGLLLNNLAAFLNLGGAPHKAIPILKNLLLTYPDNVMVLNNLGQSYANLGEADTAMYYLSRCLKIAPMHAAANHTAGVIEATKGNTTKAEAHFTNAVKASPNPQSIAALKKLKPGKPISNFLKPKFKMPGDFNPLKYQFPRQLEDASEVKIVQKEHEDFWNYLNELKMQYNAITDEEEEKAEKKLAQRMAAVQKDPFSYNNRAATYIRPFAVTANLAMVHIQQDLGAQQADVRKYEALIEKQIAARKQQHKKDLELLQVEYKNRYDKLPICGETRCGSEELRKEFCAKEATATNTALKEMAALRRDIQEKQRIAALNEFELMSYWGYLAGANESFARFNYYNAIEKYLSAIQKAAVTQSLYPPCNNDLPEVASEEKSLEDAAKVDCPFNITFNFIAGKIKLDCEKFSFSGGEGLRFNYEKEFESGASSISIGAGLGFDFSRGAIVEAGGSIGMEQSFYITFDGANNITDAGMELNAGGSLSAGFKGGTETIEIDKGFIDGSINAGYRIGINSGITFTGNAFKMLH